MGYDAGCHLSPFGGIFTNGAVTGAFAYAFGSAARDMQNGASFGDAIGKFWALPNTVVGLLYGGLGYGISYAGYGLGILDVAPSITIGNNAMQFENNIFAAAGAITIGNTITYGGSRFDLGADGNQLYLHERPHTIQSQVLGPLYLPAHGILGAGALLFNGSWHGSFNVLETGPQRHPPQPWP